MKANQTDLYLFVIPAPVSTQPDRPWLWHRGNVFFFLPQVQKQMSITRQRASPPTPRRVCRRALNKIASDTKRNSGNILKRRAGCCCCSSGVCRDRWMDGWVERESPGWQGGSEKEGCVWNEKWNQPDYVMWEEGGGRWIIASSSPHPSKNTSFCHWIFVRSVMLHHRGFFFPRMKDKSSQISPG